MAGNKLTIKLTDDQRSQIKTPTGRKITELNIDAAAISHLTDKELDQVSCGVTEIVIMKDIVNGNCERRGVGMLMPFAVVKTCRAWGSKRTLGQATTPSRKR